MASALAWSPQEPKAAEAHLACSLPLSSSLTKRREMRGAAGSDLGEAPRQQLLQGLLTRLVGQEAAWAGTVWGLLLPQDRQGGPAGKRTGVLELGAGSHLLAMGGTHLAVGRGQQPGCLSSRPPPAAIASPLRRAASLLISSWRKGLPTGSGASVLPQPRLLSVPTDGLRDTDPRAPLRPFLS